MTTGFHQFGAGSDGGGGVRYVFQHFHAGDDSEAAGSGFCQFLSGDLLIAYRLAAFLKM